MNEETNIVVVPENNIQYVWPKNPYGSDSLGGIFLSIIIASGIMIFIDFLGMYLPLWTIKITNPIALIANWIGLTDLSIGNFISIYGVSLEIYETISYIPSKLGLPIIGSIVIWMILAFIMKRGRGLVFAIINYIGFILFLISFQMTVQAAYITTAHRFREAKNIIKEEIALRKVLYISENMQKPGAFGSNQKDLFRLYIRLGELQEYQEVRDKLESPSPITIRVSNLELEVTSNHIPVPVYNKYKKSQYYIFLEKMLKRLKIPFDLDELGKIKMSDPRTDVCYDLVRHIVTRELIIGKFFKKDYEILKNIRGDLKVLIHRSIDELYQVLDSNFYSISSSDEIEIEAFYDRKSNTLHIALPESDYRQNRIRIFKRLSNTENINPKSIKDDPFYREIAQSEFKFIEKPLSHELWHFFINKMPSYDGIPYALEEGIVTYFSMIVMRAFEFILKNRQFDVIPDINDSQQMIKLFENFPKMTSGYSSEEKEFIKKLKEIQKQDLISIPFLLQMDSATLHRTDDVYLIYAECYALARLVINDQALFNDVMKRFGSYIQSEGNISKEDEVFWDSLLDLIIGN